LPRIVRVALVSVRDLMLTAGPFVLIAIALLVAAYVVLDPNPPRRVVLATGPEQSAYSKWGEAYAAELRRFGITVELRPTMGSLQNRRLLRDPKENVDLAFVQGGSNDRMQAASDKEAADMEELVSLGQLAYDPVWIFYRVDAAKKANKEGVLAAIPQMRGWRVNVGVRGSGTPGIVNRILAANLMERDEITRTNLDETGAVVALLEGKLDAAVLVSPPESQMVQMLLQTPGIRLYEYPQGESYARRYPFLSPVVLPRGVADIARDVPPKDSTLIATTTSLLARECSFSCRPPGASTAVRAGSPAPAPSPTPSKANSRSRRTRRATTRAAPRCCSATCRSGSRTWSTACGSPSFPSSQC
jgi:TRAP-type uncharacterized transport system substrate-binding protein